MARGDKRKVRSTPFDPAKREREAEIARLRSVGATVNLDQRTGRMLSAYRSNVFQLLLNTKPRPAITQGQYLAVCKLMEAWAIWKGVDGKAENLGQKVDEAPSKSRALVTDRMMRAGDEVKAALKGVGLMDAELLSAFMVATVEEDRAMQWRGIVQRVTGEEVRDRQSAMIVSALENLRRYYEAPKVRPTTNGARPQSITQNVAKIA